MLDTRVPESTGGRTERRVSASITPLRAWRRLARTDRWAGTRLLKHRVGWRTRPARHLRSTRPDSCRQCREHEGRWHDRTGKARQPGRPVTGAAQGLGLGVARRLAADGARVVLADRAAAVLTVTDELAGASGRICDVADLSRLDILVANAGGGPLADMADDVFRRIVAVNLEGPFYCCRAAARRRLYRREDHQRGRQLPAALAHRTHPGGHHVGPVLLHRAGCPGHRRRRLAALAYRAPVAHEEQRLVVLQDLAA